MNRGLKSCPFEILSSGSLYNLFDIILGLLQSYLLVNYSTLSFAGVRKKSLCEKILWIAKLTFSKTTMLRTVHFKIIATIIVFNNVVT